MKRLIIAPHYDDEILGCGGIISKYKDDEFYILHVTNTDINRMREWEEIKKITPNIVYSISLEFMDSGNPQEDSIPLSVSTIGKLASSISEEVNKIKPEVIYIPFRSLHQDHQITNHACLIALRKYQGTIVEYEYTDQFAQFDRLNVNIFESLSTEDVNNKIIMMSKFDSQITPDRDPDAIVALARIRGFSANTDFAEGFKLVRKIIC